MQADYFESWTVPELARVRYAGNMCSPGGVFCRQLLGCFACLYRSTTVLAGVTARRQNTHKDLLNFCTRQVTHMLGLKSGQKYCRCLVLQSGKQDLLELPKSREFRGRTYFALWEVLCGLLTGALHEARPSHFIKHSDRADTTVICWFLSACFVHCSTKGDIT